MVPDRMNVPRRRKMNISDVVLVVATVLAFVWCSVDIVRERKRRDCEG